MVLFIFIRFENLFTVKFSQTLIDLNLMSSERYLGLPIYLENRNI